VQKALHYLFIFTNSIALIFEIADIGYFPYVRKRMSSEVFFLIEKKSDFLDLLPNYLTKFWYVTLIIIVLIFGLVYVSKKIFRSNFIQSFSVKNAGLYLASMAMAIIAIRGGLQLRPITLSNAVLTEKHENIPLIINTSFSILKTLESQKLEALHYFSAEELKQYVHPIKNYSIRSHPSSRATSKPNVVVIILESFGKGFTGIGGRQSFTPFLDSLMGQSMTFDFAFANAYRSADGIPAVLSSIPFFMNDPFPLSPYATNKIDALPSLLKQDGYATSFFHGGTNGTMNFDTYTKNAGFESYYGRTEYNNNQDYDGTWGIWDEPFLQYFSNKLSEEKQPFFSSIFTLSSHEPFALPSNYKNTPLSKLKGIQRGIAYTDMALRKFFESASKTDWYANTLFVITADHNFLASSDPQGYYNQGIGLFSIPILFFHPNDVNLKGYNHKLMQQIDIMPSVLDYLHFNKSFFSFGQSVFDSTAAPFCFSSIDNQYYMLFPPYVLNATFDKVNALFDMRNDSTLRNNLKNVEDSIFAINEKKYHAFLQFLHSSILEDKQSFQTYH
jgi:phosphoglycerol transferase MdoB-like AlkP superfamily enzyme